MTKSEFRKNTQYLNNQIFNHQSSNYLVIGIWSLIIFWLLYLGYWILPSGFGSQNWIFDVQAALLAPLSGSNSLDIKTEDECQAIGGRWIECPPNECQKSADYKLGKTVCPEVCGKPQCEGIVPQEVGNLSEIHNPTIGPEPEVDNSFTFDGTSESQEKEASLENVANTPKIEKRFIIYLVGGVVALLVYRLVVKYSVRK